MNSLRRTTTFLTFWIVFVLFRLCCHPHRENAAKGSNHVGFACAAETYGVQYNIDWTFKQRALVLAGDVIPAAPPGADAAWYAAEYRRLDAWLGGLRARKVYAYHIVVWGSDDVPPGTTTPPRLENATVLFDSSCEVDGLTVYGTSWQPVHPGRAFYLPRGSRELEAAWARIPDRADVVVTHTPPFGIGDRSGRASEDEVQDAVREEAAAANGSAQLPDAAEDRGCALLHRRLDSVRPRLVVTSLFPDGYGTTRGRLNVVNPSMSSRASAGRPLRDPHSRALRGPLMWSLLAPERVAKVRGVQVPFVIE
eukprot:TRINITY_DN16774_c0_g1_i1.p1 TRINITY_DN16774_c0_g1~~TRINITY_DN16774_c0_g1_i1.p1  ORF type:complete len:309 (+),score=68.94 TRINITY_DN16774_c0_g1_i1:95-1021(+)